MFGVMAKRAKRGAMQELARHYAISDGTLASWRRRHLIALTDDGSVDWEKTDANLKERGEGPYQFRDSPHYARTGKPGDPRPKRSSPKPYQSEGVDTPPEEDDEAAAVPLATIERRKQTAMARKHELDVLEREAVLVHADTARELAFELGNQVLEGISRLPARYSHSIAGTLGVPVADVSAALERAVRELLTELSEDIETRHE